MTKDADANLEPFIDNLWYFDSVVSSQPPLRQREPPDPSLSATFNDESAVLYQDNGAGVAENQLPLSTGGESSPQVPCSIYCPAPLCGEGRSSRAGKQRQSMCELVERMEDGEGELPETELRLWMQKLGLEYTEDGAMIRRVPNADFGSQQKLDFSEFVCLNRFIEEECTSAEHEKRHGLRRSYSDEHMASLYEVFRLFDKDDTGLISPSDLCAALTKLGLRRAS